MTKNEIIEKMVKNGASQYSNLAVVSATVNYNGDITRGFVTLKFAAKDAVKALDAEGKEIAVDYVNVSIISMIGSLSDVLKPSVKRHVKSTPTALEDLLDGAVVSLITEKVAKDSTYTNPFASDAASGVTTSTVMTKDTIVPHVTDCVLSADGKALAKQISMFRNFGSAMFAGI